MHPWFRKGLYKISTTELRLEYMLILIIYSVNKLSFNILQKIHARQKNAPDILAFYYYIFIMTRIEF